MLESRTLQSLFSADPERARRLSRRAGPLFADLSRRHVAPDFTPLVHRLQAVDIEAEVRGLFDGAVVNHSENRPALHWACRAASDNLPSELARERDATRRRMDEIAEGLHSKRWNGANGDAISDVICLGIGGSELGPRLAVEALAAEPVVNLHFVANVDGGPLARLMARLEPARTLVLITSKSFGTSETLHCAGTLRDWLSQSVNNAGPDWMPHHFAAVTARPDRAREWGVAEENIFAMWEAVGGRYSLWSAVGLPALIALGSRAFDALLEGARSMDAHYRGTALDDNVPALAGALDAQARILAIVPYDERLRLLPEYLQQLYMESLGKSVDREGRALPDWHAPVLFGATGTRAQHAFFQALHQGNAPVITEFVGVARPGHGLEEHHQALLANLLAQATALALGGEGSGHRAIPGNRPSNVLLLDELTPYTLGALLAHYEHRVFTAAALSGVNPFDQFGVELGKRLAQQVEPLLQGKSGKADASLDALLEVLAQN